MNRDSIVEAALAELEAEHMREAIDAAKNHIRAREAAARWWHRLFPFTVKIERRA